MFATGLFFDRFGLSPSISSSGFLRTQPLAFRACPDKLDAKPGTVRRQTGVARTLFEGDERINVAAKAAMTTRNLREQMVLASQDNDQPGPQGP
jgi:hypothetical protein